MRGLNPRQLHLFRVGHAFLAKDRYWHGYTNLIYKTCPGEEINRITAQGQEPTTYYYCLTQGESVVSTFDKVGYRVRFLWGIFFFSF